MGTLCVRWVTLCGSFKIQRSTNDWRHLEVVLLSLAVVQPWCCKLADSFLIPAQYSAFNSLFGPTMLLRRKAGATEIVSDPRNVPTHVLHVLLTYFLLLSDLLSVCTESTEYSQLRWAATCNAWRSTLQAAADYCLYLYQFWLSFTSWRDRQHRGDVGHSYTEYRYWTSANQSSKYGFM